VLGEKIGVASTLLTIWGKTGKDAIASPPVKFASPHIFHIFNGAGRANEDFAAIIMGHPGGILHGRATSAGIPQGRQRFSQISADLYLTNLI
jgi:hypothetical protein